VNWKRKMVKIWKIFGGENISHEKCKKEPTKKAKLCRSKKMKL
jgi:hypothetical protein